MLLGFALAAWAQSPDEPIHEELRALFAQVQQAINSGDPKAVAPYVTEPFSVTMITQDVLTSEADVARYFSEWMGEGKYLASMHVDLEADALTVLSPDKTWGLSTGSGHERYAANNGDVFDFDTRWTALVVRGEDGRWRVRAAHFGTNHLDNPVLKKVSGSLATYGLAGGVIALVAGSVGGFLLGRRARPRS